MEVGDSSDKWEAKEPLITTVGPTRKPLAKLRTVRKAVRNKGIAQMLVKCYNWVGLSTLQNQVLALTSTIAAARTLTLAPPAFITRTAQTQPRVQNNTNIFTATA
jgi:hypothetical protein